MYVAEKTKEAKASGSSAGGRSAKDLCFTSGGDRSCAMGGTAYHLKSSLPMTQKLW